MIATLTVPGTGFAVPIEVVILGLLAGLGYALIGAGLVLTYRSTRVLNFAQGQTGALAAGVVPILVLNRHVNYVLAVVVALVVAAGTGALTEFLVIRRLTRAPRLIVLVATIGVSQLLISIDTLLHGRSQFFGKQFPVPFHVTVTVGNLRLGTGHLLILTVAPLIAVGLVAFFRITKVGLESRAAAENEDAARVSGVRVNRVSLIIWSMAGLLAGLSAVLLGPTHPIVTGIGGGEALGPSLMVRGLAAAMIGGLGSLPEVFAGGVAIGVIEALVQFNYPSGGTLSIVLFVLILASLVARRGLGEAARGGEGSSWSLSRGQRSLDPRIARLPKVRIARGVMLTVLTIGVAALPLAMSNAHRVMMTAVVLFAVMGLSLVVLVGYAGQISLGQFAFVGIGAVMGARLHQQGYPAWTALLYALLAGGAITLVVGLPALRIRGLYLAVTSLAFAVATQTWFFHQSWLVGARGGQTAQELPRSSVAGLDFGSELQYCWVAIAVLLLAGALVHRVQRTGIGRAMLAVRDNEPAAATLGISPRRIKLLAFVLSGMIAALAGYLYGGLLGRFSGSAVFVPEMSLTLLAMVILGGVTTITGAVLGALWVRGLGQVITPLLPGFLGSQGFLLVSGAGLLIAILQFPGGIASKAFELRDWVVARLVGSTALDGEDEDEGVLRTAELQLMLRTAAGDTAAAAAEPAGEALTGASASAPPALEARGVSVRFGGILAVNDVSLHAATGEIVGLVGPNGAGKTTLFDVLSGQIRPDRGTVLFEGHDITALRPEQRATRGLGRTFQQAKLFDDLMLVDVFKVALECVEPSEFVPSLLGFPYSRDAERRKNLEAEDIVDLLDLRRFAYRHVSELSTGTRRLGELGCMLAVGARVLLLDEPTAGIAQRDVEALQPILRQIREYLNATVVVIEHNIPLVVNLVDRLYVLVAGQLLVEGAPSVLRDDPRVIEAYLGGSDAAEVGLDGSTGDEDERVATR